MHYVSQSSPFYWQGVVQFPGVNNVDGFKALEEQSPRTTIQVLTTNSSHCLHVPPTHYKLSQYTLQTWSHLRSTYWHTAKLILIPKPEQLPLPPLPSYGRQVLVQIMHSTAEDIQLHVYPVFLWIDACIHSHSICVTQRMQIISDISGLPLG